MEKDKYYWIELCGFDKSSDDFGVERLLASIPQNVTGFVILFANIEFYNGFEPTDKEYLLSLDDCIYGGRRRFGENTALLWSNFELKKLVEILHKKGKKVFATVFDSMETIVDGSFSSCHGEIAQRMADGSCNPCVDVTAVLSDGHDYGQFLIEKIKQVLLYYRFDGAHYADGISSWRIPLQITDFSSRRLKMFAEFLGDEKTKKEILKLAANDPSAGIASRRLSEKVWNRYRKEWIRFSAAKWAKFYNQLLTEVKSIGKENIANIAWVRDPFEALYRYGFDYNLINLKNLSAIIVNDVNRKIVPETDSCGFQISRDEYKYSNNDAPPVMMLTKAAAMNLKQYTMAPIRDNCEKWDALSTCPDSFRAKVFRRNHCFYFDGIYKRISEGVLYCLSTGVGAQEWAFIAAKERESLVEDIRPEGFCLLYSDSAAAAELDNYVRERLPSMFWKLRELQISGLSLYTVTRFEYLDKIDMPLVCLSTEDLSENEKSTLENYHGNPLVVFGRGNPLKRLPNIIIRCTNNENCYIFNMEKNGTFDVGDRKKFAESKIRMREGAESIWIKKLCYRRISRRENKNTVKILHQLFGLPFGSGNVLCNVLRSHGQRQIIFDNPNDNAVTIKTTCWDKFGNASAFEVETNPNGVTVISLESETYRYLTL